jgi:nitrile hydratase accessory protein
MNVAPNKLPDMASDSDGPVFSEPWQAQAFAMAVSLQEQGVITTEQWAQELGAQLAATHKPEDTPENDHYYHCWLSALERLVEQTGLIEHTERLNRKQAWDRAARATPHGEPIVLGRQRDPRRFSDGS